MRATVDLDRGVIAWAPDDPKNGEPHVLPLDPDGQALVMELLADARPWCPCLFHGPHCAPGRRPSRRYACLGDFKQAFRIACAQVGVRYGRKDGGIPPYAQANRKRRAVSRDLQRGRPRCTRGTRMPRLDRGRARRGPRAWA